MNSKRTKVIFGALSAAVFLAPLLTFALVGPSPVVTGRAVDLDQIEDLINGIARFLIIVSMVIATIYIVYGGIRWISAHGNEDATKKAKDIIWNGVWGALVVLAVGVILNTLSGVVSRTFFGTFTS